MIFGRAYDGPCPKDCPRRAFDCHNEKTCENWARHEAEKKKRRKASERFYASQRMSWEARASAEKR